MSVKTYSITIPGASDMECTRKQVALATIASLNVESLNTIAAAAAKPGADGKLKQFKTILLSI